MDPYAEKHWFSMKESINVSLLLVQRANVHRCIKCIDVSKCPSMYQCIANVHRCINVLQMSIDVSMYCKCPSMYQCIANVHRCINVLQMSIDVSMYCKCPSMYQCIANVHRCIKFKIYLTNCTIEFEIITFYL
jgi:hypothetical protein